MKINHMRSFSDSAAIGLSFVCTVHCLFLPILVVALPTTMALIVEGEAFHKWMLLLVVPTSLFALTTGYRNHRNRNVAIIGIVGVLILVLAGTIAGHSLGEASEKIGTVVGAGLVALSHYFNYRLCQQTAQ